MKKASKVLSYIIAAVIIGFLLHCAFKFWDFKSNPHLYAMQSAPWYTGILIDGCLSLGVIFICIVSKLVLKHLERKATSKYTE